MARVRFTTHIVSAAWRYPRGHVVRVGASFTPDEIPAAAADAWLASGVVEHIAHEPTAPESAAFDGAPERAVLPAATKMPPPRAPREQSANTQRKPRRGGKA